MIGHCFVCLAPTLVSILSTEETYSNLSKAEIQDFVFTPHYVTDMLGFVCCSYKLATTLTLSPP